MRWKPRSPSAIRPRRGCARRANGTCSRPPEADFASTPVADGLWRAVVTMASTPNAAAVRTMAPTLCGSVIWSSARTSALAAQGVEGRRGQGIGFEIEALMHGVGLDEAADRRPGRTSSGSMRRSGDLLLQPARRVLRREQPPRGGAALRNASDHRMPAVEDDTSSSLVGAPPGAAARDARRSGLNRAGGERRCAVRLWGLSLMRRSLVKDAGSDYPYACDAPRRAGFPVDTGGRRYHKSARNSRLARAFCFDRPRDARAAGDTGECPERQRGRTVNPLAYAFVGSSPTSPTTYETDAARRDATCGCSSMVEQQPSKLMTRVRFPSPAPLPQTHATAQPSAGRPGSLQPLSKTLAEAGRDSVQENPGFLRKQPVRRPCRGAAEARDARSLHGLPGPR